MLSNPFSFQNVVFSLQKFWGKQGCVIITPYDLEMGAGTFHPATTLKALGPKPWKAAFIQPARRPNDGRYGDNPNRVQKHHQFQVILKPSPAEAQELALESFEAAGLKLQDHDIRFVEDDWESPTLGASGLGWEVWCDGMEILQFTYFQQVGGISCHPVCVELTYGLERFVMNLQEVENVYDLDWNGVPGAGKITYKDLFYPSEVEFSHYNFEEASVPDLFKSFERAFQECQKLLKNHLPLPAYDCCIHASHFFNLLDARGALSVTQRAQYIGRVRSLARGCFEEWTIKEASYG
ncbi:MAG: glycine--tRNA ligase subunit alpha [Holosporales bacterium]